MLADGETNLIFLQSLVCSCVGEMSVCRIRNIHCEDMNIVSGADWDRFNSAGYIDNPVECGQPSITFLFFGTFTMMVKTKFHPYVASVLFWPKVHLAGLLFVTFTMLVKTKFYRYFASVLF